MILLPGIISTCATSYMHSVFTIGSAYFVEALPHVFTKCKNHRHDTLWQEYGIDGVEHGLRTFAVSYTSKLAVIIYQAADYMYCCRKFTSIGCCKAEAGTRICNHFHTSL